MVTPAEISLTLLILKSSELRIDLIFNLSISWPIRLLIFLKLITTFFSSLLFGYSSITSHIISALQSSTIKEAALFKACSINSISTPLSNLYEESVLIMCLLEVFRTVTGLKKALSKKIVVVFSETEWFFPPYTPAIHIGVLPSQIIRSSSWRSISSPSKVLNFTPDFNLLISTLPDLILSKSYACRGCPISCITKLVISTILLIDFNPIEFNLLIIFLGEGLIFTSLIIKPQNRLHKDESAILTEIEGANLKFVKFTIDGSTNSFLVSFLYDRAALRSLATPKWLMASHLFGVSPISKI